MTEEHEHCRHKLLSSQTPPITNTKTPIICSNKPLSNVTAPPSKKKKKKKTYPSVDPLWEPLAIINNEYAMGPKIGNGSFGSVHSGVNICDNYRYLAIKLEPIKPNHHPQLEREYKIYKQIHASNDASQSPHPIIGIPNIFYFGRVPGYEFNALIMDMLGPSLEKLFNLCHRKFSLKTVLMIADQMLSRLEFIHDSGYLHRDLKPDNFLMGTYNSERVVYIIDLGLGKSYIKGDNKHIAYSEGKTLTGTARYASVNTHLGVEQSRRDDLESLGYIFMYFLRGKLPWQGIKAKTRHEKYEKIARKKLSTLPEQLCKGFPEEFAHLIRYSWRLGYEERPNYEQLRRMFREVFFKLGFIADWNYDWDLKGLGATNLALENHPFICGNNSPLNTKHKHSKHKKCGKWGGDKHYQYCKNSHAPKNKSINPKNTQMENTQIINAHIQNTHTHKYTTHCLPGINTQHSPKPPQQQYYPQQQQQQQQQVAKRQKQSSKFWDFSCLGSIQKQRNVNTEQKQLPIRRQSMNIPNSSNRNQKKQKLNANNNRHNSANQHSLSNRIIRRNNNNNNNNNAKQLSPQYNMHYYTQQPPQQSPVMYNNNNSYQSSSPSPINNKYHRRYSDNYANKPIITHSSNPLTPQFIRLQTSQSQRHGHGHGHGHGHIHGRRSVILSESARNNNNNNNKKSARDFYEEWKQKHKNDNLFINSISYNNNTYPYPQPPPSPLRQPLPQQQQQQQQYNNYYNVQNPVQMQQQQQQYNYIPYTTNDIYFDDINDINDINLNNLENISDIIIPIKDEIKNSTTLPLNINIKKNKKYNNIGLNNNNIRIHSPIPTNNYNKSPRSIKSHKSNKSNKSHRSSRKNSYHSKSTDHSTSNHKRLSPKSTKSSTNSPINNQQQNASKSNLKKQSKSPITTNMRSISRDSSMLVNTNTNIKSRISIIQKHDDDDDSQSHDNSCDEDDGFKQLDTQLTGRSLTTNTLITQTKDEKERKNSASTSKGLLTERDFSSHTKTVLMTPTSYISNIHPFGKHTSNSSTQQTVSTNITHIKQ